MEKVIGAEAATAEAGRDFIRDIIQSDLDTGRRNGVITRFPPEPNGYLHIGHAKSICLNFGVAQEFGGRCHLRFDDTNPTKEEQEYIDAIERDVRWLGFDWGKHLYFASDYFEQLYDWGEQLIRQGLAYVDDLPVEEVRAMRGTLSEPGRDSPFRGRSVAENLDLFRRMRAGEFLNGARTLRAKIDMAAGNMNLRDPCSTASCMRRIRAPATNGTSTRPTTSRMASPMRSSTSRIRCARSNSPITGRSMIGSSRNFRCRRGRGNTSSPASISPTPSSPSAS